jgi:hypothetical protein
LCQVILRLPSLGDLTVQRLLTVAPCPPNQYLDDSDSAGGVCKEW